MAFWISIIFGAFYVYEILDVGSILLTGDGILETVLGNGTIVTAIVEYIPGMSWVDFLGGNALALLIVGALCVIGLYILLRPKKGAKA